MLRKKETAQKDPDYKPGDDDDLDGLKKIPDYEPKEDKVGAENGGILSCCLQTAAAAASPLSNAIILWPSSPPLGIFLPWLKSLWYLFFYYTCLAFFDFSPIFHLLPTSLKNHLLFPCLISQLFVLKLFSISDCIFFPDALVISFRLSHVNKRVASSGMSTKHHFPYESDRPFSISISLSISIYRLEIFVLLHPFLSILLAFGSFYFIKYQFFQDRWSFHQY